MRKAFTLFALLLALLSMQASAQDRTITGKVISSQDNLGIPGVSVVVVGTTIGTVTDIDGNYKLNVPSTAKTIRLSSVGMKIKEIDLSASNNIDVTLEEDIMKLDEVVVTALGVSKEKKSLGYSIQSVNADNLNKAGQGNIIQSLSGKVSGVQVTSSSGSPGASTNIRLRSANSITGSNQPLFVIDGVPIDNSSNYSGNPDNGRNNYLSGVANSNRAIDINSEDIESVSILKGGAATALYGINAGNGAIIITTKKGGKATEGQVVNVTFTSSYSFDKVNRFVETQQRYGQGSRWDWKSTSTFNDDEYTTSPLYYGPNSSAFYKRFSWGPDVSTLAYDGDASYLWSSNGKIVPNSDPTAKGPVNIYDQSDFFQTGFTSNNNVSFTGGSDIATFRASFGRTKQEGTIPLSTFDKTSIAVSGSAKVSNKIKFSGTVNYTKSGGKRIQQGSNTSGLMLGLYRTPITFDNTNGTTDPEDPKAFVFADGRQRTYRGTGGYDNPYWTINRNPYHDDVNRVFGNLQTDVNLFSWLAATYRIGGDFYSDNRDQGLDIFSATNTAGQVIVDNIDFRQINSHLSFTANRKISNDLNSSLTVGHAISTQKNNEVYIQGDGLNIPTFFNISNAKSIGSQNLITNNNSYSAFFDAHLDYKYFLYLTITGRNDWTSTLPKDNRSFFYPSVSAGFVFTDAFNMSNNEILPYGKLRISYAQIGKDAPVYALSSNFLKTGFSDGWTNGISFPFSGVAGFTSDDSYGNATLKPEKQNEIEIGTDLRFLKNRIGLDLTYYSRTSKDNIVPVSIAASTGYLSAILNSGELENKGIEVTLNITPVKTKNINWDLTFNWSKNKSKVKALAPGLEQISLGGFEGTGVYAIKDQPYGVLWGYDYMHDASGNVVLDDNGSSVVGASDYNPLYGTPIAATAAEVIGDPNPDWLMGISNTVSYKGFSLYALIDIKQGGDIWNGTQGALTYFGTSKLTENRGTMKVFSGVLGHLDADGNLSHYDGSGAEQAGPGSINSTPAELSEYWYTTEGGGFGTTSKQFIQDGSYVKLREVAISYDFTNTFFKSKKFIKGLVLGIYARNLILSTDYQGVDPETNLTGAGNSQGLDYFNNPGTKSFGANLRVNF